jgi:hypothetical protein
MDPKLALMIGAFLVCLVIAVCTARSGKPKGAFEAAKLHRKVDQLKEKSKTAGKLHELTERVTDNARMIEEVERRTKIEKLETEYRRSIVGQ